MTDSVPSDRPRKWGLMVRSLAILILVILCVAGGRFNLSRHGMAPAGSLASSVRGEAVSRADIINLARLYAEHRWEATAANVRHGRDARGVVVETPDTVVEKIQAGRWRIGPDNVGLPYKWGGFDTPQSFDAGVKAGKAAGDVYSSAKRRQGDAAVSDEAVGIDCSGFVSRCWKLPQKFGTAMLPGLCEELYSTDDLKPGDIMDAPHGHVVLFVRWANTSKSKAVFYEAEAEPQPKVTSSEHSILWLRICGARPYRYLRIRD